MDIQFVRLDLDVCERLNQMAAQERRTVSELANEMLRFRLSQLGPIPADGAPTR